MSAPVVCPYCNAKSRVSTTSSGRSTRVKCRACKKTFHPNVVLLPSGEQADARRPPPVAPPADGPPAADPAPPPAAPAPAEAAAEAAADLAPAESDAQASVYTSARRHSHRSAARERLRERQSRRAQRRLRPLEMALAAALVLAGVVAAAVVGWTVLRPTGRGGDAAGTADGPPDAPAEPTLGGLLIPGPDALELKPLPPKLVGLWELRADDGRAGWIDLRADGVLHSRAWTAGRDVDPTEIKWFLESEDEDDATGVVRYVIQVGKSFRGLNNIRYFITQTSPHALTITEVIHRGVRDQDAQRFVRRS